MIKITTVFGKQMSEQEVRDNLRAAEQNFGAAKRLYRARKIKRTALRKAKQVYLGALSNYGLLLDKQYPAT